MFRKEINMDEDLRILLQEIKICRQQMYDLKPSSNDFSDPELVVQSQKLDKLIYLYQKLTIKHIQPAK
ncbi:hypothetical protein AWM68_14650 [Fictibacillus phosphorivorans]|uniref:Aspartyl-phosphate phosphatase Spo0E family protein n=2 Tax=Fictibacillus phosphorivorans TaxID=1221500 RepID=A0A163PYM4_9BACL|nr:hypothetical protein AWM68_14650 [Fictibacillus phosphorivorans]